MARNSGAKRIRIMQDGLIDEEGQRWDRIPSGNYHLTPAVRLTPDFQVVVPALRDFGTALILGLRTQLIF